MKPLSRAALFRVWKEAFSSIIRHADAFWRQEADLQRRGGPFLAICHLARLLHPGGLDWASKGK